jgi:nitrite reductase (NADH) large subunit
VVHALGGDLLGDRPGARSESAVEEELDQRQTLVIIGNGMTSFKLCQKLVEHGANEDIRIIVFGEEPRPAYDRVHLTELFSGRSEESLLLADETWYDENGIELYLYDPVVAVDRERSVVVSGLGRVFGYNRLVFATGSKPFVPPIEGIDLPGVFLYRTIDDIYQITDYAEGCLRAAVIGGGLLGLEAAKAAHDLDLKVHVVEVAPHLMPRQLDAPAAELLKEKIEELGVKVQVGKKITRIAQVGEPDAEDGTSRLGIQFEDGGEIIADLIIVSTGIRPRGELAQAAGIACAPNGGIIVDDRLQTSDPQIFAVGECATHRSITYGLVAPGYQMVDVLVANLLGSDALFQGADQSAKLKLMGVTVAALGEYDGDTKPLSSALRYTTGGVYRKLVTRQGRLIGAVTVGDWENLDRIREALVSPVPMNFWDMRRFRSTGNLFPKEDSKKVTEWAPDAMVCGCMRVTRGALSQAITEGCVTLAALSSKTGAGTVCGSCKPLIAELLGVDERETMPIAMPAVGPVSLREQRPSSLRRPRELVGGAPSSRRSITPPAPISVRRPPVPGAVASALGGISVPGSGPPSMRRRKTLPLMEIGPSLADLAAEAVGAVAFSATQSDSEIPSSRRPSSRPPGKRPTPSSRPPAPSQFESPDAPLRVLPPPPPPEDEAEVGLSSDRAPALFDEPAREPEELELSPLPPPPEFSEEEMAAARQGEIEEEEEDDELEGFDETYDYSVVATRRSWVPPKRLSMLPPEKLVVGPQPTAPAARPAAPPEPGLRTLLVASLAAGVLSAFAAISRPLPVPRTIDVQLGVGRLVTDNGVRQVTGYALLGLCVLSLVLSLRKRWKRFSWLDVPTFRAIHGVIGALTVLALYVHTGLSLGAKINFWLATDFLVVIGVGAVAGVVNAISRRWSPVAARDRRLLSLRAHLVVFWPLPVLVLLHVFQVYYY